MRSGYAVFNEFIAEYIAYTVNNAEPFPNAHRSYIYFQMAFQEKYTINTYWLSRYCAVVLGDATVSEDEFALSQSFVSLSVWKLVNQLLDELATQVRRPNFWIAEARFIEAVGRIFDGMFHEVFMGSVMGSKWR